ncbi:PQQ-binding-like beta-propeller repeat protein [Streptacidiphilus sp. MAP12-33]|uniref:serine/threonine-protein kinase n=1 Tax=Streptacidiphilus sp. MAP12-33 TaxID=3156266 RepID=UPI00351475A2
MLARLGAGGMGRVYLARSANGRAVAVKVVRAELGTDREFRDRFAREVAMARAVPGRWTAPVVDADPDAETPWLATAYVLGPTLGDAVAAHGPLPEASLRALGAGLAEALAGIHAAGLVHRDLKPGNVLLSPDGPRVIDFGIARAVDGTRLTGTDVVIGSPGYMSPEQASGLPVGPASDVFSLASVLAYAATGRAPFGHGTVAGQLFQVVHGYPDLAGVPGALAQLLQVCFAKQPHGRPGPVALAAALCPQGAGLALAGDWLPGPVTAAIARAAARVVDLEPTHEEEPPGQGRAEPSRRKLLTTLLAAGGTAVVGGVTALALDLSGRHRTGATAGRGATGTPPTGAGGFSVKPSPRPAGTAPSALWSVRLTKPAAVTPLVVGRTALVKTADVAPTTRLAGLDLASGRQLWSVPRITAVDDLTAYGPHALAIDYSGRLLVLDPATGSTVRTITAGAGYFFMEILACEGEVAYLYGNTEHNRGYQQVGSWLFAVRLTDGTTLWQQPLGSGDRALPESAVADGQRVYVVDSGFQLTARAAGTGALLWGAALGESDKLAGGPLVDLALSRPEGVLVAARGRMTAWSVADGKRAWSLGTVSDDPTAGSFGPPVLSVDGGTVYTLHNGANALLATDIRTGQQRWNAEFDNAGYNRPALVGELLLLSVEGEPSAVAVGLSDGGRRWLYADGRDTSGNEWVLVPVPGAGLVLALTGNSILTALPAN